MNQLSGRANALVQTLSTGAYVTELPSQLRIDEATIVSEALLEDIRRVCGDLASAGLGRVRLFPAIGSELTIDSVRWENVSGQRCTILIEKEISPKWCYFFTLEGWATAIRNPEFTAEFDTVWVAGQFSSFRSYTLLVSPWGGPRDYSISDAVSFERPRRLVRDQTSQRAPVEVSRWILTQVPAPSRVLETWQRAAIPALINSLPSEIRDIDGHVHVVLRGPRSTPIPIANENGLNPEFYSVVSDAVQWVYSPALDAEIKFTFLNNHLSLDWPLGSTWPAGLPTIVKASLASARDAFAFYLQGKAAESIKVMSDLRRSLQDDVSKVQQATRDLLSAVWRDFAVAGVVLALRAPSAKDAISSEALKFVTLGVAVLLVVSLLVTIASNIRFNVLSNRGRRDWRKKLYGFISDTDWNVLVEKPISSGRFVFWLVLTTTAIFYAITIWYLFSIGLSNPPVTKGSNSTLVYTAMP